MDFVGVLLEIFDTIFWVLLQRERERQRNRVRRLILMGLGLETEKWWFGEDFKFGFGATVISVGSEPRLEKLG
jgi:hypothetical protein